MTLCFAAKLDREEAVSKVSFLVRLSEVEAFYALIKPISTSLNVTIMSYETASTLNLSTLRNLCGFTLENLPGLYLRVLLKQLFISHSQQENLAGLKQ